MLPPALWRPAVFLAALAQVFLGVAPIAEIQLGNDVRAHVEAARQLLATTRAKLPEIAKRCGFTNPALMNAAFVRELGMPPGVYRRRLQRESGADD